MQTIEYACIGKTEFNGRCRTVTTLQEPACVEHLALGDALETAPTPDLLLVKFFVSRKWADKNMANTPVVVKTARRVQEIDIAHKQRSDELGVDHTAYRQKGDTGCAVFGKDGLPMASLEYLEDELEDNGYFLHDLHVEVREDKPESATIVLEYKRESTREILPDPTARKRLFGSTWAKVDVWVNPGGVTTINARIFQRDESPRHHLIFAGGSWGAA